MGATDGSLFTHVNSNLRRSSRR